MYATYCERISSPSTSIFAYNRDFVEGRIDKDGTFKATIEDLALLTGEQSMVSAGLEALEDLVTKIAEEIRMRGLATNKSFDADIHETKYEEFRRRYQVQ